MAFFKTGWSQNDSHVLVVFTSESPALDFQDVSVTLTSRSCNLSMPGGQSVSLNLFDEIDPYTSQRNQNRQKLALRLMKKNPNVQWKSLKKAEVCDKPGEDENGNLIKQAMEKLKPQDSQMNHKIHESVEANVTISSKTFMTKGILKGGNRPSVSSDCQKNRVKEDFQPLKDSIHEVHQLKTVKHDWYEVGSLNLVFTIYIAQLDPLGVTVVYEEKNLTITMKTSDEKFHAKHGTSVNKRLLWSVKLSNCIVPGKCSHRVLSKTMELRLQKKEQGSWKRLLEIEKTSAEQNASNNLPSTSASWRKISQAEEVNEFETSNGTITPPADEMGDSCKPLKPVSRPTCKVGFTGLNNLGNTCFMNSVLQALANTRELRNYFLGGEYENDINITNPLGMKGRMVKVVVELFRELWSGSRNSFSPTKFKDTVGQKETRFTDLMQHDAQEFMSFLLDTLHEDVNRILVKPYTEAKEEEGRPDHEVAKDSWRLHKSRNDSFIVDLFHGLFKSKLDCPICGHSSVKFDPFLFLPVPLPKAKRSIVVYFHHSDPTKKSVKISLGVEDRGGTAMEIFRMVGAKMGVPLNKLHMFEVYRHRIHRFFLPTSPLSQIQAGDIIYIQETRPSDACEQDIYELAVMQRTTVPKLNLYCARCQKIPTNTRLKRCLKCLHVGYCNQECQKADWPMHRKSCMRTLDMVGSPFFICIAKKDATFRNLCNLISTAAKRSVSVRYYHHNEAVVESPAEVYPFALSKISWNAANQYSAEHQINDKGEEVIDLDDCKFLALDWQTDIRQPLFVKVESTPIEYDEVILNQKEREANIRSCLELFTEPEVLSSMEAWYCPRCKEHREATKQMSIWQLPDVLIIQLKRFSFKNLLWRDKIDMHVDFPVSGLDMSEFCVNPEEKNSSHIYDLYAVVNHHGGIFGGHYTSYVRLPAKDDSSQSEVGWRLCDDSHIRSLINTHQVVSRAAYVVMYKRRDSSCAANIDVDISLPPQPPDEETGDGDAADDKAAWDIPVRSSPTSHGETSSPQSGDGEPAAPPATDDEGDESPSGGDREPFYLAAFYMGGGRNSSTEPGAVDEISGEPLIRYEEIFDENSNIRADDWRPDSNNQNNTSGNNNSPLNSGENEDQHADQFFDVDDDVTLPPVTSLASPATSAASGDDALSYTDMDMID